METAVLLSSSQFAFVNPSEISQVLCERCSPTVVTQQFAAAAELVLALYTNSKWNLGHRDRIASACGCYLLPFSVSQMVA